MKPADFLGTSPCRRTAGISWSAGEIAIDDVPVADWSPQGVVHFINSLDPDLAPGRLMELDAALGLSGTRNAEIGRTWFIQVARRQLYPAYGQLEQHLQRYGRTRLVRPVYKAMADNGDDLQLAQQIFAKARYAYHPLTVASIEAVLVPSAEFTGDKGFDGTGCKPDLAIT